MIHNKQVLDAIHELLIQKPGSEGIVGYSEDEFEPPEGGQPGIRIYVANDSVIVPDFIANIPTHKIILGQPQKYDGYSNSLKPELLNPKEKQRPIIGGIAIGSSAEMIKLGTLGYFIKVKGVEEMCFVTSAHVANFMDGIEVQPPIYFGGTEKDKIGDLLEIKNDPGKGVECAAYRIAKNIDYRLELNDIPNRVTSSGDAKVKDIVMKSGAITLVTRGPVTDVKAVVKFPTGEYKNLIMIEQQFFAKPGDSGSLVVVENKGSLMAVGLILGGSESFTYACPIKAVLDALKATIAT